MSASRLFPSLGATVYPDTLYIPFSFFIKYLHSSCIFFNSLLRPWLALLKVCILISSQLYPANTPEALDVQVVSVGRNSATNATGLKFWPEKITAEPGTMVQFQFWAGNHTVTQSTFDDPCIPIGNVNSSVQGIYSGYMPVEASMAMGMIPTYTIEIKDKKPLWLYCSKAKHCQGGMSMVINEK